MSIPGPLRRFALPASTLLALSLAGCGMNAQTLQAYTPGAGVNVDAPGVKVRNLLVIADNAGKAVLSTTVFTQQPDTLSSVTVQAHTLDGSDAGAVQVTASPLNLQPNTANVLTAPTPAVKLSSANLKPGLTAQVTLVFGSGAQVSTNVPVLGSNNPDYADIPLS